MACKHLRRIGRPQPADEKTEDITRDWFNIADYNRITGNVSALFAQGPVPGFPL